MSRIILVDVDDVVADLCPVWIDQFLLRNPSCPDPRIPRIWDTWDVSGRVDPIYHKSLWETLDHGLYGDWVEPLPGALEGVNILRYLGFRVIFATSCAVNHAGAKLKWLHRHGFVTTVHFQPDYVEISDKSLLRGEALIDDRPKTLNLAKDRDPSMLTVLLKRHFTDNHLEGVESRHVLVENWPQIVASIKFFFDCND